MEETAPRRFFILGAPKTGTTALARYFAEHPSVHFMTPKEPQFYNTDHGMANVADRAEYDARAMPADPDVNAIGEGSVWYLYSQDAVPNIEAEGGDPRYIVSLRNPLELAPSLHLQMLYTGFETERDFARAWAMQDDRRAGRSVPPRCPARALVLYREACLLGEQLQRLYAQVPRDRVHVMWMDDFRSDPGQWWRGAQGFLGLREDGRTQFEMVNERTKRRSGGLHNIIRRADGLATALRLPRPKLGIKRRIAKWNTQGADSTTLPPDMRAKLMDAFSEDIALLGTLTGRDLTHWLEG